MLILALKKHFYFFVMLFFLFKFVLCLYTSIYFSSLLFEFVVKTKPKTTTLSSDTACRSFFI